MIVLQGWGAPPWGDGRLACSLFAPACRNGCEAARGDDLTAVMKTALITGGARGIGFGIAEAMLAAGYAVTVTGLTADEVAAVPQRDHLTAIRLDVTDAAVGRCRAGALRAARRAGQLRRHRSCAAAAEFNIETFARVIDVNLTGTMRMCVGARPKLLPKSKAAPSSTPPRSVLLRRPMVPAYTASKGGVAQLTKALAVAWAQGGHPRQRHRAGLDRDRTDPRALAEDAARSAAILARTPLGRWGEPDDIGGAVVFLCSDAARFVTGTVLPVDGGYAAM